MLGTSMCAAASAPLPAGPSTTGPGSAGSRLGNPIDALALGSSPRARHLPSCFVPFGPIRLPLAQNHDGAENRARLVVPIHELGGTAPRVSRLVVAVSL